MTPVFKLLLMFGTMIISSAQPVMPSESFSGPVLTFADSTSQCLQSDVLILHTQDAEEANRAPVLPQPHKFTPTGIRATPVDQNALSEVEFGEVGSICKPNYQFCSQSHIEFGTSKAAFCPISSMPKPEGHSLFESTCIPGTIVRAGSEFNVMEPHVAQFTSIQVPPVNQKFVAESQVGDTTFAGMTKVWNRPQSHSIFPVSQELCSGRNGPAIEACMVLSHQSEHSSTDDQFCHNSIRSQPLTCAHTDLP